jgi:hypothetical protein
MLSVMVSVPSRTPLKTSASFPVLVPSKSHALNTYITMPELLSLVRLSLECRLSLMLFLLFPGLSPRTPVLTLKMFSSRCKKLIFKIRNLSVSMFTLVNLYPLLLPVYGITPLSNSNS